MPKPFDKWTVFPHGPIEKVAENVWRVEGRVPPNAPISRTMIVVRLADRRLVIHNAIALDEPAMKEIEAWGSPSFLIVPNGFHRLDARIFKERYPNLRLVAPPGAKARIEEVVKVDDTNGGFGDEAIRYEVLGGTGDREGVLFVRSQGGTTLVFTDAVMNMQKLPGFGGLMMGLFGFTGPAPKVPFPTRMVLVTDKKALRAHFERLAETPGLRRLEVAHGAPVTERAAEALRGAASGL
jgi:hypothetical protein